MGQPLSLPLKGQSSEGLLEEMEAMRGRDIQWRDGQAWSLVFDPGEEIREFVKSAYGLFISENALNPSAFPSLRRMENETVSMVSGLLGGDGQVCGNLTTGGTESILMAVKAARDHALKKNPRLTQPEIVLPVSAHPAFEKAAHYFGLRPVHVALRSDFRANVKATRKALSKRTVLMVASAPSYPQGVVDPIVEMARVAVEADVLFHVDACVGGMMLPFVKALGYPVPAFDFAVPGVTSMSVDLHKYGYAAKGSSLILFRNAELRRPMFFAYTDWPGGIYASPTMTGTRPGGAIAASWAILKHLGFEGYRDIAQEVMETTVALKTGIGQIDGVEVLGRPHMSVFAIGSEAVDIYEVGDQMQAKGWHLDRQQFPPCLHITVNRAHVKSAGRFLEDLRDAVALSQKEPIIRLADKGKLLFAAGAAKVLPSGITSKLTQAATSLLGVEGAELPGRSAAMYGMMGALPNRGDLKEVVLDLLDKMTRMDP